MEQKRILHLTLKKKWFDMIASGEKKEEYREIKGFWTNRFTSNKTKTYVLGIGWTNYTMHRDADDFKKYRDGGTSEDAHYMQRFLSNLREYSKWKEFDFVCFTNGYYKNAPRITIEFKGFELGKAKPEWSDNWQGEVFIIKLGEVLSIG